MAKNIEKDKQAKPPVAPATVPTVTDQQQPSGGSGDWGQPISTSDAVAAQLKSKTDADVARQASQVAGETDEQPERGVDPVEMALKEVEAHIAEADNVKLAYELLQRFRDTPAKTKLENRIKAACIERVEKHCRDIQNGVPIVTIGADEIANHPSFNNASIQAQRVEMRSRGDLDIKDLLAENASLKQQLEQAKKKD